MVKTQGEIVDNSWEECSNIVNSDIENNTRELKKAIKPGKESVNNQPRNNIIIHGQMEILTLYRKQRQEYQY